MTGLTAWRTANGRTSLRQTAAEMPSGTATTAAPRVTSSAAVDDRQRSEGRRIAGWIPVSAGKELAQSPDLKERNRISCNVEDDEQHRCRRDGGNRKQEGAPQSIENAIQNARP